MKLSRCALIVTSCAVCFCACAGMSQPGGKKQFLTATAETYELGMQKNGRMDLMLADGVPVIDDAYSMVWLEGEDEPRTVKFDGRLGTREEVNDSLGRGNGLLFAQDGHELLVQTYPNKPFLTVQTAYRNTGKKPVRVKMLLPWCAGRPNAGGLSLGNGAAQCVILENGRVFTEFDDFPRRIVGGPSLSQWNSAVFNPANGRSFIAGFLTNSIGYTQIRLERSDEAPPDRFDLFRAECVYDPPVELNPGDNLRSERLYAAVSERNPVDGLDRYGRAVAVANRAGRRHAFLPHGWDSWSTKYRTDIDEAKMLAALEFIDKNLKRYGWAHFALDDGWQRARGDWEADSAKFPHGMKWFADRVHERGMTAGIWLDPFRVDLGTPVAKEHPDWLRAPNETGKGLVGENERIIDITAPGAYEYVRDLARKITHDWGYDALMEADYVYLELLCESYHDPFVTRLQAFRKGMEAIREGMGRDRFLMSMPPLPVTGLYANGMRVGNDCAPVWQKAPDRWPWGCVDALTNAARRFYYVPYLYAPDVDCAFFGGTDVQARWNVADQPPLTRAQSIAWLTGAALTGGVVKIGEVFNELTPDQTAILQRLLPVAETPARPVDLFESEHPRIWHLPLKTPAGDWHILALFNWDPDKENVVSVALPRLGVMPGTYFTVYDFWNDTYHGTVRGELAVNVPAGSVQLLGLRRFDNRPMFLAHDRHIAQGALDISALAWDAQARRLSGTLDAVGDTVYNLRVLVPEGYTVQSVHVAGAQPLTAMDERILKISVPVTRSGPLDWQVQF